MNELIEQEKSHKNEIVITIFFFNGEIFKQDFPIDKGDMVEGLLEWYRDAKSEPTLTWNTRKERRILSFNKSHIRYIEIEGYIELTRITHKWYEKLFDKFLTKIVFLRMRGGDKREKQADVSLQSIREERQGRR